VADARGELSALGTLALSLPLGRLLPRERFDPAAPHPTPVVLVHGFLGDPSNFLVLRSFLSSHGVQSLRASPIRRDSTTSASRRGSADDRARLPRDGLSRVDVVGHSLGGLVARYLVEMGDGNRVGRLVTLGSPYFSERRPSRELAILGAHDPLVPPRRRSGPCGDRRGLRALEPPLSPRGARRGGALPRRSGEAAIGSPAARAAA